MAPSVSSDSLSTSQPRHGQEQRQQQRGPTPGLNPQPPATANAHAELAQAFRDLARGEQTATVLEANLASLEGKLDELLTSFENTTNKSAGGVFKASTGGGRNGQLNGK